MVIMKGISHIVGQATKQDVENCFNERDMVLQFVDVVTDLPAILVSGSTYSMHPMLDRVGEYQINIIALFL
jgi:hypothetical protein